MININELRRLAQAALIGPDGVSMRWLKLLKDFQEEAYPSVICELLDRLELAENERDRLALESQENGTLRDSVDRACEERDALRAKITEMEKQEPVTWRRRSDYGWSYKSKPVNGLVLEPLYLAPGAKGEEK